MISKLFHRALGAETAYESPPIKRTTTRSLFLISPTCPKAAPPGLRSGPSAKWVRGLMAAKWISLKASTYRTRILLRCTPLLVVPWINNVLSRDLLSLPTVIHQSTTIKAAVPSSTPQIRILSAHHSTKSVAAGMLCRKPLLTVSTFGSGRERIPLCQMKFVPAETRSLLTRHGDGLLQRSLQPVATMHHISTHMRSFLILLFAATGRVQCFRHLDVVPVLA